MDAQQLQCAGDLRRPATVLAGRRVGVQQRQQVAVAEAVDRKFAARDRFQQTRVFGRQGIQGAPTSSLFNHAAAQRGADFSHRGRAGDARQPVEVTLVGRLRDFRAWVQVG